MQPLPIPFTIVDGQKYMKRSDRSRLRYRVQRYLSYLSNAQLSERLDDIFTNLMSLAPEGDLSIGHAWSDEEPFNWLELFGDVQEEYALREMGFATPLLAGADVPRSTTPHIAKGAAEIKVSGIDHSNKLVRFGHSSWLDETFKTGKWRLSPATSYDSRSLCNARRDVETQIDVVHPDFVRHPKCPSEVWDDAMPDTLQAVHRSKFVAPSDYFIACFSRSLVYRLFDDFSSDSCLIVTNEQRLVEKLNTALKRALPGWHTTRGACRYIDPYLPPMGIDIHFAKHMRYSYQKEFRFVVKPFTPSAQLSPIYIELGPLHDCCELLRVAV